MSSKRFRSPTPSAVALRRALVSGAVSTATSSVTLAAVAIHEGHGAAQAINATSHWLFGDGAARRRNIEAARTGVGLATHFAASVFWAACFERWVLARPSPGLDAIVRKAVAVSALAAVVDYTITPKRFTPGWELVLSKRSMALVYASLAAGLVAPHVSRRRMR